MSDNDSEVENAMSKDEAPDGVRRSDRPKSNKLRRANMKNDNKVSSTLDKLYGGDISSDDIEAN